LAGLVRRDHPAAGAGGTLALDAGSETVLDILPTPRPAHPGAAHLPTRTARRSSTTPADELAACARSTTGKGKPAGDRHAHASVYHQFAPIATRVPPHWRLPRRMRSSRGTIPGRLYRQSVEMSGSSTLSCSVSRHVCLCRPMCGVHAACVSACHDHSSDGEGLPRHGRRPTRQAPSRRPGVPGEAPEMRPDPSRQRAAPESPRGTASGCGRELPRQSNIPDTASRP